MMGSLSPASFERGIAAYSSPTRLCLNQTAYELRELLPGERSQSDDLVLRHLRTPSEIDMVRPLRGHIDLTHSAGDPRFEALEKKETR